jgi:hypothetical protein
MNTWIKDGWWPDLFDFCQMVVFAFWWLLAIAIAAGVIYLVLIMVVSKLEQ